MCRRNSARHGRTKYRCYSRSSKSNFASASTSANIIIDENDIFGDGVNIAVRLEGIAEPGGVCISDDAYRQIRGKLDTAFDDMGPAKT